MVKSKKYEFLIDYFTKNNPNAETELHYENPFQLVMAVVLSAQCTDKRVNMVTPALFERFKTPKELAESNFEEIFSYIKSISFPNNKSKHLLGLGKMLVEKFNSEVPSDLDELQKLPGVGRKTANVVASVVYHQPRMAVDTHVFRVSRRMGLVAQEANTPLAVEKELVSYLPEQYIAVAHHWLILHGRYTCIARKPKCDICALKEICDFFEQNNR